MADYGGAVVAAVKAMLAARGGESSGLAAASHRGTTRKLPDKVAALRVWLRDERAESALSEWNEDDGIGLPAYHPDWSHTPLRLTTLPIAWSASWRSFHDKWVQPELDLQRLAGVLGAKRSRNTSESGNTSLDLANLETLEELQARNNDVRISGDLIVEGLGHFAGIRTAGADFAEVSPTAACTQWLCPNDHASVLFISCSAVLPESNFVPRSQGGARCRHGSL